MAIKGAAQPERSDKDPGGNRVAVITGSSRGIGKAIALRLAQDGLDIVINDIEPLKDDCEVVAQEISKMGRKSMVSAFDVSDSTKVKEAFQGIKIHMGRVDIVIANAGICGPIKEILDFSPDEFDKIMKVNVNGVYNTITSAAEVMIEQGWGGRVIAAASVVSFEPTARLGPYSVTKWAVKGMIQLCAKEWAKHGIRANCYAPGICDTPMWDEIDAGYSKADNRAKNETRDEQVQGRVLLGRLEVPEDVAKTVSFLASPDSEYITGQTILCDGGMRFA